MSAETPTTEPASPYSAPVSTLSDADLACPLPEAATGLTLLEIAELLAIPLVLGAVWLLTTPQLVWTLPLGTLLAYCSAAVLGQGLVRDLTRLATRPRTEPTVKLACLCVESSTGLGLLAAGLLLLFSGVGATVELGRVSLVALLGGLFAFGFVAKDYVLVLKRVKDHGTIRL